MATCPVCKVEFIPINKKMVTCGHPKCVKLNSQIARSKRIAVIENKEYYDRFPDPPEMKRFLYTHLKAKFKRANRTKGSIRNGEITAMKKLNEYIAELTFGDPVRDQLVLEREFCRVVEKERLRANIKAILHEDFINGTYTLQEIGNVLGVSRERVRQMEVTIMKVLKHPDTGIELKQYFEDLEEYDNEYIG